MFLCAAETAKSPEDDSRGPDRSSAVFLWRGHRSGVSGRDGAALQSSSPEDSQVRLQTAAVKHSHRTRTKTQTFQQIILKLYFFFNFNRVVSSAAVFNVDPMLEKSFTRILICFNPTGCVIYS